MQSQIQFLRNFSQNAHIGLQEARDYLHMIENEIGSALAASRSVKIPPIGTLKRALQPSKTIKYLNDPSKNILILDKYYAHLRPSSTLKNRLKGIAPKLRTKATDLGINVGHSILVPIKIRPRLPHISWRQPMSGLTLDLRTPQPNAHQRLLRNFIYLAKQNPCGVSINPSELTIYGDQKSIVPISQQIYSMFVDTIKKYLPQTLQNSNPWRLLVNLPPREMMHFTALPADGTSLFTNESWLFHINYPSAYRYDKKITTDAFNKDVADKLNQIFYNGQGNIAVIGNKLSRSLAIKLIRKKLDGAGLHYHYFVEHHHHSTHPHLTHPTDMRQLSKQNFIHEAVIFNDISAADSLYHLHSSTPISIYSLPIYDKNEFLRLLRLQQIRPEQIDLILENYAIPSVCSQCASKTVPAVKYTAMRRLAVQRSELLHVHPVSINTNCDHETIYELITIAHSPQSKSKNNLNNILYHLALDNKINAESVEEYII